MNKIDLENLDFCSMAGMDNILYRKETTDFNCLKEVLIQKCYQSKKHNVLVEAGETWLDLGGNIGAFGLFCNLNGARVISFEPDFDCCEIMAQNYQNFIPFDNFSINQCAVTNKKESKLKFYRGGKISDRYRTSIIPNTKECIELNNIHFDTLKAFDFTSIKMDIEGSEFGLIDDGLIPKVDKLIFEYHITKDKSMENFHKRMNLLRDQFKNVHYMPSLDRFDKKGLYPGFFDRIIVCSNL